MKKLLSLVMVLLLLASVAVVGVSAAEDTTIYFEVPSDWANYNSVFCHLWEYGGDSLAPWQGKKEKCTQVEGNLYSYDISKVGGLTDGTYYGVIFSVDIGLQTYDTLMSTECYGDTLYSDGTLYENPQDSSKTAVAAFWKNQDAAKYGPVLQITSIGNVIGTCLPPGATAESVFTSFLTEWLDSARQYSGKNDQAIIDDMAKALGLTAQQVADIIEANGTEVEWKFPEDVEPTEAPTEAPTETPTVAPTEPAVDDGFAIFDFNVAELDNSKVKVGDTFKCNLYMDAPDKIEDIQGYITYNAEYVKVLSATTPNIYGAIINTGEAGTVYFNATEVNNGMDFATTPGTIIEVEFEVLEAANGQTIVTPQWVIEEMTQFNGESFFTNSEKVNDEVFVDMTWILPVYEEATQPTTLESEVKPERGTEPAETNVTGGTDAPAEKPDVPTTGANIAVFATLAVVAMAAVAVVILRKKQSV